MLEYAENKEDEITVLKKINLASNAIEHWDIYRIFVISSVCFNYDCEEIV